MTGSDHSDHQDMFESHDLRAHHQQHESRIVDYKVIKFLKF
jgi:hypothetical protein